MSDPAIEAAERAWAPTHPRNPDVDKLTHQEDWPLMVGAAREALAPLRELHRKVDEWGEPVCAHCVGHDGWHLDWPCDTARLIYPSEEL